jgi:hypothetical protein
MGKAILIGLASALLIGVPVAAKADLVLDITSVQNLSDVDFFDNPAGIGNRSYREFRSSLDVLDPGGTAAEVIGNTVDAHTRYASITGADSDTFGIDADMSGKLSHYTVALSVTASPSTVYDLQIDTSRLGAAVLINDCHPAHAAIGEVAGALNGTPYAELGLDAGPDVSERLWWPCEYRLWSLDQSSSLLLEGLTGSNDFMLDFQWTTTAESYNNTNEAAVLMGINGSSNLATTADDYNAWCAPLFGHPNPVRDLDLDGHFVGISAEITGTTPEPATLAVFGLGAAVLTLRRRRVL